MRDALIVSIVGLLLLLAAYAGGYWYFLYPYRMEGVSLGGPIIYNLRSTPFNNSVVALYSPILQFESASVIDLPVFLCPSHPSPSP